MSNDLGIDRSGNGNNWTVNNITYSDQVVDSPTNNFATLNPIAGGTNATISEGNLKKVGTSSSFSKAYCTIPITSGKWYMELCAVNVANNSIQVGVTSVNPIRSNSNQNGEESGTSFYGLYNSGRSGGYIFNDASATNSLTRANDNDIIGIAFDADAGNVKYYINNTLVGSSSGYSPTNVSGTFWFCLITRVDGSDAGSSVINFGQDSSFAGNKTAQGNQDGNDIGDFYYTPPTGFLALCTSNLPDVAVVPSEHFNTVLYSGTGSSQSISGVGFQPDFVWFKERNGVNEPRIMDAVRGLHKTFKPHQAVAEDSDETSGLTGYSADGVSIGSQSTINTSGNTYVLWNWKANGSGSSNTDGTITSTVSANVNAGFSIVSYTGSGSSATVGHGLSTAPDMIITKSRDGTDQWIVQVPDHLSTDYSLRLHDTGAAQSNSGDIDDPTNTNIVLPSGWGGNNTSDTKYIAYCFHSVDGYSKCGSYTGSGGTDGTFVYTGFRPAFVLIKRSNSAGQQAPIYDSARDTYNETVHSIKSDDYTAELTNQGSLDLLSNGFKAKNNEGSTNTDGGIYIYIAFAESPFKYSNAR